MPYALFDRNKQISACYETEAELWKEAVAAGLVHDVPVADEAGGQVLPKGYQVKHCAGDKPGK